MHTVEYSETSFSDHLSIKTIYYDSLDICFLLEPSATCLPCVLYVQVSQYKFHSIKIVVCLAEGHEQIIFMSNF